MKLIQSYVQDKYFVSTVHRQSSALLAQGDVWYYETLVWEWNSETKERGAWLESYNSGWSKSGALTSHARICKELVLGAVSAPYKNVDTFIE